jgi:hypothetical protein
VNEDSGQDSAKLEPRKFGAGTQKYCEPSTEAEMIVSVFTALPDAGQMKSADAIASGHEREPGFDNLNGARGSKRMVTEYIALAFQQCGGQTPIIMVRYSQELLF